MVQLLPWYSLNLVPRTDLLNIVEPCRRSSANLLVRQFKLKVCKAKLLLNIHWIWFQDLFFSKRTLPLLIWRLCKQKQYSKLNVEYMGVGTVWNNVLLCRYIAIYTTRIDYIKISRVCYQTLNRPIQTKPSTIELGQYKLSKSF